MVLEKRSIGAAVGRDYSTIQAWEDQLDNGTEYNAGDDALGECYDDGNFDENVIINGGATLGLNSVTLSVVAADRHTGTANTGARMLQTSGGIAIQLAVPNNFNQKYTVEWLEIDKNGQADEAVSTEGASFNDVPTVKNMIIHGADGVDARKGLIAASTRDILVMNCIVYDLTRSTTSTVSGIWVDGDKTDGGVYNCTVANIRNPSTGPAHGIQVATNSANSTVKNNISMDTKTADFEFAGTSPDSDYNLSEDDTADDGGGSNNLINNTYADQFVSTTSGSEDYHLVTGSDAIDAGVDLVTTPSGVEIDIDGEDRTDATTWDIGAHEFELPASGAQTRTHTTDALLKKTQSLTHTTDALIKKEQTVTHTTDSLLKKTFSITHTTDALLKKLQSITHTTDSLLKKTLNVTHTVDSLLKKTQSLTHTTDAFITSDLIKLVTHTTDALLKKTQTVTHTTNALLKDSFTLTHTTDSLVKLQTLLTHTTNSLLKKTQSLTHTTDSALKKTLSILHTTDAFIISVKVVTHTTDTLLKKLQSLTHTTDATLKKTLTLTHTTDSFLDDGSGPPLLLPTIRSIASKAKSRILTSRSKSRILTSREKSVDG